MMNDNFNHTIIPMRLHHGCRKAGYVKLGHGSDRRFSHPLFGASLGTLVRLVFRYGPVSLRHLPALGVALASATARWPFGLAEKMLTGGASSTLPSPRGPLFIIGHWRSGTTHLGNILSRSPEFTYVSPLATGLPGEFLTLGRILRPILERSIPSVFPSTGVALVCKKLAFCGFSQGNSLLDVFPRTILR